MVKQEVKDKRVYKLLQRGEDDTSEPADMARVARSSYLGKDPFGDKTGKDDGLEPEQLSLLRSLQDRIHTYARVHCTRILSKEMRANVAEMEARHAKKRATEEASKAKRIPWTCYKACMLMALPKSTGLYELGLVLAMVREKGETPQQWAQRLDQGRTVVGRKLGGNNLSDECYIELLLRGLLNKEKGELIKAEVLRQTKDPFYEGARVIVDCEGEAYRAVITRRRNELLGISVDVTYDAVEGFDDNTEKRVATNRLTADNNTNTHAKAMEAVRASSWLEMCERVNNNIGPQPYFNYKPRKDKRKLYTYQQALLLSKSVAPKKRKRGNGEEDDSASGKGKGGEAGSGDGVGEGGQKRKRKHKAQTRKQTNANNLNEEALLKKFSDLDLTRQCPYCKQAGRKFNHPYKTCNWRPGGCWHGLKGEELKKARDKFFNELKAKRAESRRSSKKAKAKARVKARAQAKAEKEEESSSESSSEENELSSAWWYSRDTRTQVTSRQVTKRKRNGLKVTFNLNVVFKLVSAKDNSPLQAVK